MPATQVVFYREEDGARSGKYDHILPEILTTFPGLGRRPDSRAYTLDAG
ncbi:MAG: hypothetical protein ACE5E4_13095 [Candidatus Binatia bacterium]